MLIASSSGCACTAINVSSSAITRETSTDIIPDPDEPRGGEGDGEGLEVIVTAVGYSDWPLTMERSLVSREE